MDGALAMYCANCGESVTDEAQFCTECGAEIPAATIWPAPSSPSRQPVNQVPGEIVLYAGFGRRFVAHLLDLAIVGTVVSIISTLLVATDSRYAYYDYSDGVFAFIRFFPMPLGPPIIDFLYVLSIEWGDAHKYADYFIAIIWPSIFGVAYHVVLLSWKGQTIGKAIMGVLIQGEDTHRIRPQSALLRETFGKAVSSFLYVGFLVIALNQNRRGLHDSLASTQAVQVPAGFQLWRGGGRTGEKEGLG